MANEIKIDGAGFTPLKDYGSWRIATLLPASTNNLDSIEMFGKHNSTDEVFLLLSGIAYLVTAGYEDKPSAIHVKKLSMESLYVINAGEWHVAVLEKNSKVLIVENCDTTDSCTVSISREQYKVINEYINSNADY